MWSVGLLSVTARAQLHPTNAAPEVGSAELPKKFEGTGPRHRSRARFGVPAFEKGSPTEREREREREREGSRAKVRWRDNGGEHRCRGRGAQTDYIVNDTKTSRISHR